jgi:hypothetical protein
MRVGTLALAIACSFLAAPIVSAHHTIPRVDDVSKTVALTGTVTRMVWKQPHVIYDLAVTAASETPIIWEVEAPAPHILHRDGIEPGTINVGDRITMHVYVALDGAPRAATESVVLANGRTVRISMRGTAPPEILPKGTTIPH